VQNRYPRTVYCEGALWQALERLAYERQRSVDDLIDDALRQYVGAGSMQPPVHTAPTGRPPPRAPGEPWPQPQMPPMPPMPPPMPHPPPMAPPPLPQMPHPPPAPHYPQQQQHPHTPAPPPPAPGPARPGGMYVDYAGYRYPVSGERFIIGRSRKECDLAIPDTNVSRQHAVVEWFNGCYHIVDMGSTNGIEFAGQRVHRRIIREGDQYVIAGHELRFGFA
jgi:hypothetical protein